MKKNILTIMTISLLLFSCGENDAKSTKLDNWITINYSGLINTKTITHNGDTVGQIIKKIPNYTNDLKGLIQQYLEPYSILCHDVLLSSIQPNELPLINILSHYPIGAEQPAWVALFREGHYQLYYNNNLIRVFIKGSNAKNAFNKHKSVIKYPITDIINSMNTSIDNLEVYVFNNNYANKEIKLNTTPKVIGINELDLSAKQKSIDLTSIKAFLSKGVILKAIEVDADNNLYFYGTKSDKQTINKHQISLSDIAVIYRAIFHYGNNAPYISLDKNEDNRYAKVNFGGHLENTYVGNIVLESDKFFKTLVTGLDSNTHNPIKEKITQSVPDFLTQHEHSFVENEREGSSQIRYWFYPDSIGTITDGSIGVISTNQFLANTERMDRKVSPSNAVRKTINHLNRHYSKYEDVEITLRELSTVGGIMALINWLKKMNINNNIELDGLLSVKIPAFTTPKKIKKMLAITTASYLLNSYQLSYKKLDNSPLNSKNVRKHTKVYYLSDLLDKYSSITTDKDFLKIADNYLSKIDAKQLMPSEYVKLENDLELITSQIKQKEAILNRYNSKDVDYINNLIGKQNKLVRKINSMNIQTKIIASIGGGISLRPDSFKPISHNRNSPKIKKILKVRGEVKTIGNISVSGDWIRSNPNTGKPLINTLFINKWKSSSIKNNEHIKYTHLSNSGDKMLVVIQNSGNWLSSVTTHNFTHTTEYDKNRNQLFVSDSNFSKQYLGIISQDKSMFNFSYKNQNKKQ